MQFPGYKLIKSIRESDFGSSALVEKTTEPGSKYFLKYCANSNVAGIRALKNERRFAQLLDGVPGFPRLNEVLSFPDHTGVLFEFIEGRSLDEIIRETTALNSNDSNKIISGIIERTKFLHDQKPAIIHCDLAPDNILVTSDLEIFITDFGLSKFENEDVPAIPIYKKGYSPPEAEDYRDLDRGTDVFSVLKIISKLRPNWNQNGELPSIIELESKTNLRSTTLNKIFSIARGSIAQDPKHSKLTQSTLQSDSAKLKFLSKISRRQLWILTFGASLLILEGISTILYGAFSPKIILYPLGWYFNLASLLGIYGKLTTVGALATLVTAWFYSRTQSQKFLTAIQATTLWTLTISIAQHFTIVWYSSKSFRLNSDGANIQILAITAVWIFIVTLLLCYGAGIKISNFFKRIFALSWGLGILFSLTLTIGIRPQHVFDCAYLVNTESNTFYFRHSTGFMDEAIRHAGLLGQSNTRCYIDVDDFDQLNHFYKLYNEEPIINIVHERDANTIDLKLISYQTLFEISPNACDIACTNLMNPIMTLYFGPTSNVPDSPFSAERMIASSFKTSEDGAIYNKCKTEACEDVQNVIRSLSDLKKGTRYFTERHNDAWSFIGPYITRTSSRLKSRELYYRPSELQSTSFDTLLGKKVLDNRSSPYFIKSWDPNSYSCKRLAEVLWIQKSSSPNILRAVTDGKSKFVFIPGQDETLDIEKSTKTSLQIRVTDKVGPKQICIIDIEQMPIRYSEVKLNL